MPSRSARDKRGNARLQLGQESNNGIGKLSPLEEEFIYAAEFGNIPTAERILRENPSFSVDYNDILGRTPLRLAVGNEHLEVVELLLDRCNISNIHEALLQAISAGHEQIAETILKHPKYRDIKKENKRIGETDYFYTTTSEDSPFSADITPLILAAERNQFEIIQLLLLRGEMINKPHHYYCACQECSNKLQFDQLRLAKTRLNAYKGLASGAYISLSSKDPVLTAFELARELRRVARVEKYFKNEYLDLAAQLSNYVVKLLDKVRGHDELEIVLNKSGKSSTDESYERLSRFKLAILYSEKKFVAHPSCQQKLVSIWYSDLRILERSNWFLRAFIVFLVSMGYPILALIYWFLPKSRVGKLLHFPCIKFIGHTLSFIAFLVLILISSLTGGPAYQKEISEKGRLYENYRDFVATHQAFPNSFRLRASHPQAIDLLLSLWIVGMLWQEIKQLTSEGFYSYFDSLYNFLDHGVITLYITSFTLRLITIVKVHCALNYFLSSESWIAFSDKTDTAREHFYWLLADRLYWNTYDPHIIAEGLFAIANVISFTRISYLLPANELFGPMQISVARMITDIMKFMVIFGVIFLAFMVGLHNLYWYYPKDTRKVAEFIDNNISDPLVEGHFGTIEVTFQTIFWSLFGRGDSNVVELGDAFNHVFTQNVGYCMFGTYNIATVIVLLNMLIAMMSRSFEIIQEEADTEWKFARSKLYMEYINDDSTLPVPFNIMPTYKAVFYIFNYFWRFLCPKEPEVHQHPGRVKDLEMFNASGTRSTPDRRAWDEIDDQRESKGIKHFQERMSTTNGFVRSDSDPGSSAQLTYQRVMKRIIKRYIFDMQRESDLADGDFDELKQDISSFRYEMLNNLSNRQREMKENAQRLDTLQERVDKILQQQVTLLKYLGDKNGFRGDALPQQHATLDKDQGQCQQEHPPSQPQKSALNLHIASESVFTSFIDPVPATKRSVTIDDGVIKQSDSILRSDDAEPAAPEHVHIHCEHQQPCDSKLFTDDNLEDYVDTDDKLGSSSVSLENDECAFDIEDTVLVQPIDAEVQVEHVQSQPAIHTSAPASESSQSGSGRRSKKDSISALGNKERIV